MTPSVVAAFTDRVAADAAVARLRTSGPPIGAVRVDTAADAINAASVEVDEMVTGGFFGNFAKLLDELLGYQPDDRHAVDYADMVARNEAMIVTVELDSSDAVKPVADFLSEAGAKRVSTLPQPGLEGG